MRIINSVISILASTFILQGAFGQTVKTITVRQNESYTDHISLAEDARDKDLMVKFVFNENENKLTVSLISYRNLFVFWDNVRFKPLVKGRTLRPDMLPYVTVYEPTDKFKVSKKFKWSIPYPQKDFSFSRWIEYEGMQPVPQEYKMVNDFISQTFDVLNKRSAVMVRLRDVMLIDDISKSEHKKVYEIPYGRDLYLEYQVIIDRNPCYGLEEEIETANKALESVTASYASLDSKFGSGVVATRESLEIFESMKSVMLQQYPSKDVQTPCPELLSLWGKYNNYVEKIGQMTCAVRSASKQRAMGGVVMSASELLDRAKRLDKAVARWLVSDDNIERRDIVTQCKAIIREVHASGMTGGTPDQMSAIGIFRAAEHYFTITCLGK